MTFEISEREMRKVREWNLNWQLRLSIAGLALAYLIFSKPWNESDQSVATGAYTCSAALLVLALVPRRTRLWVAVLSAIALPFLVDISIDVFHLHG
jgi:hypothetical protein